MASGKKMSDFVYSFVVCFVYLLLALIGMTMIKLGHGGTNGIKIPFVGLVSARLILGMSIYAISFLFFVFFVSKMKISVALPIISGANCALTAVVGCLVFKERITVLQVFGIAMIAIGTVMVGVLKK